jgi:hypothetical protein
MYRIGLALAASFVCIAAAAQPAPSMPTPPLVIEPADTNAFREILETTIPPRYHGALIRWYAGLVERQQRQVDTQIRMRDLKKSPPAEPEK